MNRSTEGVFCKGLSSFSLGDCLSHDQLRSHRRAFACNLDPADSGTNLPNLTSNLNQKGRYSSSQSYHSMWSTTLTWPGHIYLWQGTDLRSPSGLISYIQWLKTDPFLWLIEAYTRNVKSNLLLQSLGLLQCDPEQGSASGVQLALRGRSSNVIILLLWTHPLCI